MQFHWKFNAFSWRFQFKNFKFLVVLRKFLLEHLTLMRCSIWIVVTSAQCNKKSENFIIWLENREKSFKKALKIFENSGNQTNSYFNEYFIRSKSIEGENACFSTYQCQVLYLKHLENRKFHSKLTKSKSAILHFSTKFAKLFVSLSTWEAIPFQV